MKTLIIFGALIGLAISGHNEAQVVHVKQDSLGNYNLQYGTDGISRIEQRTMDGTVNGGYSYVDPHGILRSTAFTSGQHGFHAVSSDIPTPVQDTPEVALAKSQHLALLRNAHLANTHTIIPQGQFVHKSIATSPAVEVDTVPVTRVEKIVEKVVPVVESKVELPVTVEVPSVRTSQVNVIAGDKLFRTSIPLITSSELLTEKLLKADIPLLRTSDISFQIPTDKLIKTDIPLVRTSNVAVPLSEVPSVKSGEIAIEATPTISEKLVKTEIPVLRTNNILETAIPVLRSDNIAFTHAKVEVPTERRFIETDLLKTVHPKLEAVESSASFLDIPSTYLRFSSIESPKTRLEIPSSLLKFASIETPKTRLEIPTGSYKIESIESPKFEIPVRVESARSEVVQIPRHIGLDTARLVQIGNKIHVLRNDDDFKSTLSKVLLRQ